MKKTESFKSEKKKPIMSLQEKRRKKTTKKPTIVLPPTSEPITNPSLPDDLLISCLARVSRLYYPSLSLVSKSFRSLLNSPELYETRSSLGNIESCLYVCIRFPPDPNPRWFTLGLKPNRNLTKKKKKKKESSGYVLAAISVQDSPHAHWSGLVSVGSNIYNVGGSSYIVGGSIYKEPVSSVSILDCRFHTWSKAPNMNVVRCYPAANFLDGKIYVTGGCEECTYSNWMEVFDPKTQTWELVLSRGSEICGSNIGKSAVVDKKIYIFGKDGLSYEPRECKWERVGRYMELGWSWSSYCVIENMVYCYYSGVFKWYDFEVRQWRIVKGVEGLPKFADYGCVKLADYGGKLVVFWDKYLPSSGYKKKTIWCAVIELERHSSEEIWGKVEWLDLVLTVPVSYDFVCALAATV